MGKYDFIRKDGVVPVRKKLVLQYEENYGGEIKDFEVNVYPYTVEEKLTLQTLADEAGKLIEGTPEQQKIAGEKYKEYNKLAVYYVLKKDDPEVSEDIIDNIPSDWVNEIVYTALEFEGISKEAMKEKAKKAISEQ
jgi:hypothetical protein